MTDWDHQQTRPVEVLQGAFLLVRRAAFQGLRGFDERFFMYYEDVDLAYRAHEMGWGAWYLATARAYHRGGGTTDAIKAERLSYWMISRLQYVRKHFGTAAALEVLLASLTLEAGARLAWNILSGHWQHLGETAGAYGSYMRGVMRAMRA
jgi:GT2 family glycosyltransferase